jgi:hypothetical protein
MCETDLMSPSEWPGHVLDVIGDPSARPRRVRELLQILEIEPPGEMTLIGIDEWTTFFELRWFFTTSVIDDDVDDRLHARLTWELNDDLGNIYLGGDYGGGGGNSAHWTFTSQFAPCIHECASSLSISVNSPISGRLLTATISLM